MSAPICSSCGHPRGTPEERRPRHRVFMRALLVSAAAGRDPCKTIGDTFEAMGLGPRCWHASDDLCRAQRAEDAEYQAEMERRFQAPETA